VWKIFRVGRRRRGTDPPSFMEILWEAVSQRGPERKSLPMFVARLTLSHLLRARIAMPPNELQ
jgi:hypothetical protein